MPTDPVFYLIGLPIAIIAWTMAIGLILFFWAIIKEF